MLPVQPATNELPLFVSAQIRVRRISTTAAVGDFHFDKRNTVATNRLAAGPATWGAVLLDQLKHVYILAGPLVMRDSDYCPRRPHSQRPEARSGNALGRDGAAVTSLRWSSLEATLEPQSWQFHESVRQRSHDE